MSITDSLFDFIAESPSAYHAVATARRLLETAGYIPLPTDGALQPGGRYFTVCNGSSLIALRIPQGVPQGFSIVAVHGDSPSFRIKRTAQKRGAYTRLEVERYGGGIHYSWLDRPLSFAGRVLARTPGGLTSRLVAPQRDLMVIPSLAIHMNREVNDKCHLNPATDLLPLFSMGDGDGSGADEFYTLLAAEAGCRVEDIVSHDLFLFVRERGRRVGAQGQFILSPRLDDLGCAFPALHAFLTPDEGRQSDTVPVFALFDNEEVGSATRQGAASPLLADTLRRVAGEPARYAAMLSNSFMVSADNAHALHPNRPEMADPDHAPLLGKGLVIKFNANQRYATDGVSDAIFRLLCERVGAPVQIYYNRADLPGGSTLGSISNTCVPVITVDIGLPQLAMHAAVETAAAADLEGMTDALREVYATALRQDGGELTLL